MTLLHIHLVAVSAWLGLLAAETVIELSARDSAARRLIARMHKWIDLLFEGPLVATVLITGSMLLARVWPPTPLLMLKVGAGLVPVIANIVCFRFVLERARASDDATVIAYTRKVAATGYAIPFAIAAMIMGLVFFSPH